MRIDAVLPAGGRIGGRLAREMGTDVKALLPVDGKTVLERTLATLRASGRVGRIVVVGPSEVRRRAAPLADAVLPETESGAGNILQGLRWLTAEREGLLPARALILTTDLPFLTGKAITGFLDACSPQLDLCVPIIERREFQRRFSRPPTRFVYLRDGAWMIGCAFLISPTAVLRNQALIARVFAARRSQLGMARLLGPAFILRFATRLLTVRDIERKCLQLLGCTGGAVRGCAPELGFDIDYAADYHYAIRREPSESTPRKG